MKRIPKIQIQESFIPFDGGLDMVTPALKVKPGYCRDSNNVYQGVNGGYKWGPTYERYNGEPSPSDASYVILNVTLTGTVSVNNTVIESADGNSGTTSASGVVIAVTDDYLVLSKVTGSFVGGTISVAGVSVGTSTSTGAAVSALLDAQYKNLAADLYRNDISAVTGSGDVLGIWYYNGNWYAFRNNAGGTAAAMFKASSTGWTAVSLGYELSFTSGGTYEIAEGDTITGEVGGATAVVKRVVHESGTFAAGTAAGRLIFASQTGTFEAETIKVGANLDVATIAANSTAITLQPDGRFEFINDNFTGSSSTYRMYGADGENRAFEFDGTVFAPIDTGMSVDTPLHIYGHKKQLFLSYGDQVQHSSPGYPYLWALLTGADQLGMGETVTGFINQPGTDSAATIAVFTRNSIGMLYGNNVDDWNLIHYKREAGAIAYSAQYFGNTFMMDDRGITQLQTSQAYGNFQDASVSQLIQPLIKTKRAQLTASCIVRDLNQYWLFFADKSALCCTMKNGKIAAIMPITFEHKVTCICSAEDTDGNEVIMFGSDDGYVYQLFKGTSMDGTAVSWRLDLAYDFFKTPMVNKNFRRAMIEISGEGYSEFNFSYALGYNATDIEQPSVQDTSVGLAVAEWDSGTWDSGTWDTGTLTPEYFPMEGTGTNLSIKLAGESDYCQPLTFSGVLVQYNYTRTRR